MAKSIILLKLDSNIIKGHFKAHFLSQLQNIFYNTKNWQTFSFFSAEENNECVVQRPSPIVLFLSKEICKMHFVFCE